MLLFAERAIAEGADIVVMGHHHKPSRVTLGKGVYVNLGDWIAHNSFGAMTGGTIALKTWNGQQEI
jgi:UDP-2,3-diacylglucosamine pyrophosphatase LpxH